MERFFGFGSVATGAAITMLNLHLPGAGPTTRPRLYEIGIGCGKNAPADIAAHYTLGRTTAIGTEDAGFIPVNLDPDGPAAQSDLGVGFTGGEPTYTANAELMSISMNQRATYRWVAAPGGELIIPATQNCGLGLKCVALSSGTTAWEFMLHWEE